MPSVIGYCMPVREQALPLQLRLAICRGDMFCLQQFYVWFLFGLFAMMMQQLCHMWGTCACTRGRKRLQHVRESGCHMPSDDLPGLSILCYAPFSRMSDDTLGTSIYLVYIFIGFQTSRLAVFSFIWHQWVSRTWARARKRAAAAAVVSCFGSSLIAAARQQHHSSSSQQHQQQAAGSHQQQQAAAGSNRHKQTQQQ